MSRDNLQSHEACRVLPSLRRDDDAQRLVGLGFRYWVSGYQSGDIDRWEKAWKIYSSVLGPQAARTPSPSFPPGCGPSALQRGATSKSVTGDCAGFCRDECLAVSMIAACQHNTCPAMRACAFAVDRELAHRRGRASRGQLRDHNARARSGAADGIDRQFRGVRSRA